MTPANIKSGRRLLQTRGHFSKRSERFLKHRETIELIKAKHLPKDLARRSLVIKLVNRIIDHPEVMGKLTQTQKGKVGTILALISGKKLREKDFV